MYSTNVPEISEDPIEFGTSGLLYRGNKLMYDRTTETLWRQFTGKPVVGELVDRGIALERFPVVVTTWEAWSELHPDTTVLSRETGIYPAEAYVPESDIRAIYYAYFHSADLMFPVWTQSDALPARSQVLGVILGNVTKAYPLEELADTPALNDEVDGTKLLVLLAPGVAGGRAYLRGDIEFEEDSLEAAPERLTVRDRSGVTWQVTEEALVATDGGMNDGMGRLDRLPSHSAFWFGWYAGYPNTMVHGQGQ